jgi:hypothetical protein
MDVLVRPVLRCVALGATLISVVACGIFTIGPPSGPTIAVKNDSGVGFVASEDDGYGRRFFAIDAGTQVTVDTTGHENPPTDSVVLYDAACNQTQVVRDDFLSGALITVAAGGAVSVHTPYVFAENRPGADFTYGEDTCAAAAAKLAAGPVATS